jgi:Peptidase family M48
VTKIIETNEYITARSLSLLWFKRIYVGYRYLHLNPAMRLAVLAHEEGHLRGHHTEWRILALLVPGLPLWLAKQQEYWADAYACRAGHGLALYWLLADESDGGHFHPSNCLRRQKLVHNKFFASSTLQTEPGTGSANRTVGVTN